MRTAAEWLLLPLFLLPLVVAGGLLLWARSAEDARLQPYRTDARAAVRSWLTPPDGPAAWMPERVASAFLPGGRGLGEAADYVTLLHPEGTPRVRLVGHALGRAPWRLAADLPSGLPVEALADAGLRLQLEAGTPAVRLDGIDTQTAALASLLDRPDLDRLRDAELSAATKGYLLRRWRLAGSALEGLADAERLMTAARRWERAPREDGEAGAVGTRAIGDLLVVETGGDSPVLLPDGGRGLPVQTFTESAGDERGVGLHWVFPPDAPTGGRELWRGAAAGPLRGTFVFTASHGSAWYEAPAVRRFSPPIAALLLLFLALPLFLLVAMRRRRHLDEARVRFINEMAHDLRTPLTSLRLHADLVTQGRGKPERKDAYLATIARESARLSELLENLLDIARLERGTRAFEIQPLAVGPVAGRVVEAHALLRPDRRGDVEWLGSQGVQVRADRAALTRVLANLLDNAGKFTSPGTPVRITWSEVGGRVRIDVADEGPGIPAEERARVFQRYERGTRAQTDGLPGSGLGLALVAELVEGMGGTVVLVPSEAGTRFRVELPGVADA